MIQNLQIPGLQPNSTYVVQIRGVADSGAVGPWSTGFQFDALVDQIAPSPVTGLTVEVDGPDFVINWVPPTTNEDGSLLEDLRDYYVTVTAGADNRYYSTTSNGFVFSFSLNRNWFVTPRPSVSVTVQARDRVGNLSAVTTATATNQAPSVSVLTPAAKRNAVELTWTDAFAGDGHYYAVYKNSTEYARVAADTLTWTDTDVGPGAQAYFVRAYDLFGQTEDSNTVNEAEVSIGVDDTTAPKAPTSLLFASELTGPNTSSVEFSWIPPTQDTDNTSYTDNEGFEVRYRFDALRPWTYVRVPDLRADPATDSARISTEIQGFTAGESLLWEVRAFDRSNNYSAWAISTGNIAADNVAPADPTGLVVDGGIRTIIAKWAKNPESDIAGYRVYAATAAAVALTEANLKFDGLGTSASFAAGDNETWYVRVVAYDLAGNVSGPSLEQSATTFTIEEDTTPPSNVTGLALSYDIYYHGASELARVRATWDVASDNVGVYGYIVAWRRVDTDVNDWTEVVVTSNRYVLTGIQLSEERAEVPGEDTQGSLVPSEYVFRVKALDAAGNASVAWSTTESVVIAPDGAAPGGEIKREVPITFDGALQSDNFVNLLRGFRISERSFELYGDENHDVSMLLGSGGQGLNLSTINSELWFGSRDFANATWRVGPSGGQRSGGPGAVAERLLSVAEYIQPERWVQPAGTGEGYDANAQVMYDGQVWTNTSGDDNITEPGVSGWTLDTSFDPTRAFYQTATPTANATGDIWSDGATLYRWDGLSWVDEGAEPVDATDEEKAVAETARAIAAALYRGLDEIFAGEGNVDFSVTDAEPVSPAEHDVWFDLASLYIWRVSSEDVDGVPVITSDWYDLFDASQAFYISAAGDIWSGGETMLSAPWSISAGGRARFTNASILGGQDSLVGASLISVTTGAGDSLFTIRKSDVDTWDMRVGMDMFLDAGGHLQLAGGDISLTSGSINLDGGTFNMTAGELNLAGTPVNLTGSDINVTGGNIIIAGSDGKSPVPQGIIQSADYNYEQRQGWALDSGNLYLFSGEISAEALDIGNEQNLLDYGYTTMSYPPAWYDENVYLPGTGSASLTSTWSRYGPNSLRLQGSALDGFGMVGLVDDVPDFSKVRIEPGLDYIFSAYVHNLALASKSIQLFVTTADGAEIDSPAFAVAAGATERVSFIVSIPMNAANGAYVGVRLLSDTSDFAIDGMLFEQRTGSGNPSVFNIGGATTIDGGSIKTGAIVSNNYLAGETGWRIGMDGQVEFQGGIFRGQLFASDLVSGTIDNQEFLLSDIEQFVQDPGFDTGWDETDILQRDFLV